LDLITGALGVSGTVGVAASAGVVIADKTTEAFVGKGARITADGLNTGLNVAAGAMAVSYEAAGAIDYASFSDAGQGETATAENSEIGVPALGLTTDVDDDGTNDRADQMMVGQRVATPATRSDFHGLSVTASNRDDIETLAVSIGGGEVGIALGAAVNLISTHTRAWIGEGAVVNEDLSTASPGQDVLVGAANDFYHMAVTGTLGVGEVGISPCADVTLLENETLASIGSSAQVKAANDILVRADAKEAMLLVSAGAAGGYVGIGGSVNVLTINNTTKAGIGANAGLRAGGDAGVFSDDATAVDMISGALGAGFVGIGASVGVVTVTKDTQAFIDHDATVDARGAGTGLADTCTGDMAQGAFTKGEVHGVVVQAGSKEDIFHLGIAVGAGFVGVSGSVTLSVLDSNTTAWIGANARVNQTDENAGAAPNQAVYVNAANEVDASAWTVGGAGGLVGVGGVVSLGSVMNDTAARIGAGAQVTARGDVEVNGLSLLDLDNNTRAGAGGLVGVAGAVSVWSVGTPITKTYSDGNGGSVAALERQKADYETGEVSGAYDSGDADVTRQAEGASSKAGIVLRGFAEGSGGDRDAQKKTAEASQSAADSMAEKAPNQMALQSKIDAPAPSQGTEASVAAGAKLTAGGDITVSAKSAVNVALVTAGIAGGFVGAGGAVLIADVAFNTTASAAGTFAADGNIGVLSRLDETLKVQTLSAGMGAVGVGASVAQVKDKSLQQAILADGSRVEKAGDLTVSSVSKRNLKPWRDP
jgi:hypothetical protein